MKIVIITEAGISQRFNQNICEERKVLKGIYYEDSCQETLLYHLLKKCTFADKIAVVGGYQYKELENYIANMIPDEIRQKIILCYNPHYWDLASGYSLYVGLDKIFSEWDSFLIDEILFIEGDLDVDCISFRKVVEAKGNVLTFNYEPIYANKAVVLYRNAQEQYRYAFNTQHGLLHIADKFSCILNSGQIWKFKDANILRAVTLAFKNTAIYETNLWIVQKYLEGIAYKEVELVGISHWVNCNTKNDYSKIKTYWEEQDEES